MHRVVRRVFVCTLSGAACVVLALLVLAPPAGAHTTLEDSRPKDGARVTEPPSEVQLVFSGQVDADLVTVIVRGAGGDRYESGPPQVDGQTITQRIHPLGPAGEYEIAYRVVSADGHPVTGTVAFALTKPGPGATPTSTGPATPSPVMSPTPDTRAARGVNGDNGPLLGIATGIAALLAAAGGIGAVYARRRKSSPE